VRLFGPIGAGVDVSFMTHDADAAVTASVPHPFFFRQPRNISGATKTTRREIAGHIRGVYLIPGRRLDVMIFGGPSLFSVRQTLVTDVTYSETYPFDTATFTAAQTTNATAKLATGFHVGLDVGWKLSDNVGIGGMAQFARAKATLTAANNAPLKVDAGGLLAGAGIRLAF